MCTCFVEVAFNLLKLQKLRLVSQGDGSFYIVTCYKAVGLCKDMEQSYELSGAPENWGGEGESMLLPTPKLEQSTFTVSNCFQVISS